MTPYFRQRGPPALVAMLPPMELSARLAGIGRIKKPALFHGVLKLGGVDGGLDDGDEIGGIDFQNFVHPLRRERDAAAHRHAAADVAVARAARRDGNFILIREPQNLGNGFGGAGQGDGVGLVRGEPFVAGVFCRAWRVREKFRRAGFFQAAEAGC